MSNDNTIIFTLARMNPPTPGHLFLIRRLIEEGLYKNVNNVYVILSKTNDNNENPISCQEKMNVLGDPHDPIRKTMINVEKQNMIQNETNPEIKQKIKNINVNVICVPDIKRATPFTPLIEIINSKTDVNNINLILVIGEDRQNLLDSLTQFFLKWDNIHSIDGIILPREEMNEYKELSKHPEKLNSINAANIPTNALSASFVRNIVKNHKKELFVELYKSYLDVSQIEKLYTDILNGIKLLPDNKKKDVPPTPLKYTYPVTKKSFELNTSTPLTNARSNTRKRKKIGGTKRNNRKIKRRKTKKRKTKRRH